MEPPHHVLVEILHKDTQKKKILACQSEQQAQSFVKLFNLVSAFNYFEDVVADQQSQLEKVEQQHQGQYSLYSKEDQKRIEQWVQNFVIRHQERKGETMSFENETIGQCKSLLQILNQFFKDNISSLAFTNNTLNDSVFQSSLYPVLQNFQNLQKLEITNNRITTSSLETFGYLFQACQQISDINISSNYIGGGSQSSGGERALVDFFLYKFFTEL